MKHLVRAQLEFYFSRENLIHDKFLSSQMDSDNYVLISTIASFNKIKKYKEATLQLIQEAIDESTLLQIDPTGCKVRAASKRCVIILREITDEEATTEVINVTLFKFQIAFFFILKKN